MAGQEFGQRDLTIRSGGIKNTGLRGSGIQASINRFDPSKSKHKMLMPHIKQIGSRQVGFRQAVVPVRGIKSRSVSARAQALGNFSYNGSFVSNPTIANRNPYINPYT